MKVDGNGMNYDEMDPLKMGLLWQQVLLKVIGDLDTFSHQLIVRSSNSDTTLWERKRIR